MSNQVLVIGGEDPLEFFPAEPTVDELDEQVVALILCRAAQARRDESARRAQGLPARQLTRENEMVQRFAARLGERGSVIAAAVLALSRPAWTMPPRARRD